MNKLLVCSIKYSLHHVCIINNLCSEKERMLCKMSIKVECNDLLISQTHIYLQLNILNILKV